MLPFRDVPLNRGRQPFDIHNRMSPANNNTNKHGRGGSGSDTTPEPADQMAHELANLLDGSLRHLGIVIDTLRDSGKPGTHPIAESADPVALLARLQTTDRAMRQMVSLIHAWMKKAPGPMELFDRAQTLGQMLEEVVLLHEPAAKRYGIELYLSVDDTAGQLSAGPIFPIVANGLRNAIEAVSDSNSQTSPGPNQIQVVAGVVDEQLQLCVRDNGPGLAPSLIDAQGAVRTDVSTKGAGHGLGLTLSRQIARSLDGTLELTPRHPRGVELTLRCPVSSLTSPLPKNQHA